MAGPASFLLERASVLYEGGAALRRVDLAVGPGEVLALVGPSGAGKTTLLRLLNGSLPPGEGRVQVDGRDLATLTPRELRRVRSRIGFVPQDFGLVPNLRVSQNVLSGALGRRGLLGSLRSILLPSRAELERVHELLSSLGIDEKIFQRADALSGGQQQRAALARALFQEPSALLADEPLSSLDPARSRETLALLIDVARARGLTLVLSMHDIALARELVPRLVGLRHGRVELDLPAAEVDDAAVARLYSLEAAPRAERGGGERADAAREAPRGGLP